MPDVVIQHSDTQGDAEAKTGHVMTQHDDSLTDVLHRWRSYTCMEVRLQIRMQTPTDSEFTLMSLLDKSYCLAKPIQKERRKFFNFLPSVQQRGYGHDPHGTLRKRADTSCAKAEGKASAYSHARGALVRNRVCSLKAVKQACL